MKRHKEPDYEPSRSLVQKWGYAILKGRATDTICERFIKWGVRFAYKSKTTTRMYLAMMKAHKQLRKKEEVV